MNVSKIKKMKIFLFVCLILFYKFSLINSFENFYLKIKIVADVQKHLNSDCIYILNQAKCCFSKNECELTKYEQINIIKSFSMLQLMSSVYIKNSISCIRPLFIHLSTPDKNFVKEVSRQIFKYGQLFFFFLKNNYQLNFILLK